MQKHRISTNIGKEQKVTVELKQDYDLLEILSLKFSQKDIYTSLCADYGVVCGRITANDGFGIPNARVSIFVEQKSTDADDPVISALYPYTDPVAQRDENNYRYNLLPARKQHGGHVPTGTFPDQSDILTREEVLEVFESYYRYTVKTNESGDFMIWGVPTGLQKIHVDLDLSDIGCFSLRPYDFIKRGEGIEKFERYYNFKSSSDIDGLPQIIRFDKTIEVFPFWGNEDLCELGITRTDFDISEGGIRIEPISLILTSTFTDDNGDAVKRSGVIRRKTGYKCNLQTTEGKVTGVRYTGNKVYGSDGVTLYPELEYFYPSETIDEDGSAMVVLPMNMEYVYTNEFGEQEITNDPNKGIPTTTTARFKFSLDGNNEKTGTANYLVPQIREYSKDSNGQNSYGEYNETLLTTYQFSNVFEDYLNIVPPSGLTLDGGNLMDGTYETNKKNAMLGTYNNGVPEDVFYKFIFGKVYTVSSFQGSHYEVSAVENFLGLSRRDAFLGIKEIRPNSEDDCTGKANYFPVNFAFRNRIKFGLIISEVLLFIQYIFTVVTIWIYETLGSVLYDIGGWMARQDIVFIGHALADAGFQIRELSFRLMEGGQTTLPLTTYPDCEECSTDVDSAAPNAGLSNLNLYYRSVEIKTKVVPYNGSIYLVYLSGQTPSYLNSSTTTGTTFLPDLFVGEAAKEIPSTGITESQITSLHTYVNPNATAEKRFISGIYPLIGTDDTTDIFNSMYGAIDSSYGDISLNVYFRTVTVTSPTNTNNSIRVFYDGNQVYVQYVDSTGGPINTTEDVTITLLIRNPCNYSYRTQDVTIQSGSTTSGYATMQLIDCGGGFTQTETYERITQFSPTGYREYNTGTSTTYTNVPAIALSYSDWAKYGGKDYTNGGIENIKDLYAVVRVYDKGSIKASTSSGQFIIEQGCSKYDKFYDESNNLYTYLWSNNGSYGTITDVSNINNPNGNGTAGRTTRTTNNWGTQNNSYHLLGKPYYTGSPYVESTTSPGANYSIVATIAGGYGTRRLPNAANLERGDNTYSKKTKSGLTEIRDGVVTIVPVIDGPSRNQTVIKEWYKRKRVGIFFCGGVVNYSFIDNWLNGVLYFFKFDKRIKWDNVTVLDLNQRGSKFPRELVFYNVLDQEFYYRATPYIATTVSGGTFIGQNMGTYKEILHPTTFYDVGVRDEFLYEICTDPRIDPTCSVIRDVNTTSYQDPANVVEYAINYRMDISDAKFDVGDFFTGTGLGDNVKVFDGDITQLMSINCEAGIEAFDLDSPHYFIYNGELMDPEDSYFSTYFKSGNEYSPVPIDFKLDLNGVFIRQCLNFRLGDYTQKVPFFLWNKGGTGFGSYGGTSDQQKWDRTQIASMKLQRLFSISGATNTVTNYLMADGEEEYLLKPMTITHPQYSFTGDTTDMLERFDNISLLAPSTTSNDAQYTNVEGDIWLHVTSGTTKNPLSGVTYVVVDKTWTEQTDRYVHNFRETFMFQTKLNYSGTKQVLSTPFLFYFGLRPDKTSLDTMIKYYGPKGAFPSSE